LSAPELERQPFRRKLRRKIRQSENRMHAGDAACSAGVDAANKRVRVRAPHKRGMEHPGKLEIVEKTAAALKQRTVFYSFDRSADVDGVGHSAIRSSRRSP
jgi:hypothetical protein